MGNCVLSRTGKKQTETFSKDVPLKTVTPRSGRGGSDTFNYDAYSFNTWIDGWASLNVSSISFWWGGVQRASYSRGGAGQQGTEYPRVYIPANQALQIRTSCSWEMSSSLTFYECPWKIVGRLFVIAS